MKALIISDPNILGGKPVIFGTRISVELILDRITSGMSMKDIIKDYPHISVKQIQAAISFARNLVSKKSNRTNITDETVLTYAHEISR